MEPITNRVLEKIKKCMALADSDNPAEAAAALRQAQKLMAKYDLTMTDLELSSVSEVAVHNRAATRSKNLPEWVCGLRILVADAFQVEVLNRCQQKGRSRTHFNIPLFLGRGDKPHVAQYVYEILFRQLTADRQRFYEEQSFGVASERRRQADVFCASWVRSVTAKVEIFAMPDEDRQVIERFKETQYGKRLVTGRARRTKAGVGAAMASAAGSEAAKDVTLFHGVSQKAADGKLS